MKLTRADRRLLDELQRDATRNQTDLVPEPQTADLIALYEEPPGIRAARLRVIGGDRVLLGLGRPGLCAACRGQGHGRV